MAKERCFRSTFQHGRLWQEGEVRTVSDFDESNHPIASSYFRILDVNEKVPDEKLFDQDEVDEVKKEAGLRDRRAAIESALKELDHEHASDWTAKGLPSAARLAIILMFDHVSRAEIDAAWPGFDRKFLKELREKGE